MEEQKLNNLKLDSTTNCNQLWYNIYSHIDDNNISQAKELFISSFGEEMLNLTEEDKLYLHPLTAFAARTNNIDILNWLFSIPEFEIDSFQLYLVAVEYNNVDIIDWGIRRQYEFLPQHILHTIRCGSASILDYLYNNLNEEDVNILFNELFIKNAIICKHHDIIEWYKSYDIEINEEHEELRSP